MTNLLLIYYNNIYNRSKLCGPNTKKWVGQKNWRANELGGPVPGRLTRSAVTGVNMLFFTNLE